MITHEQADAAVRALYDASDAFTWRCVTIDELTLSGATWHCTLRWREYDDDGGCGVWHDAWCIVDENGVCTGYTQ